MYVSLIVVQAYHSQVPLWVKSRPQAAYAFVSFFSIADIRESRRSLRFVPSTDDGSDTLNEKRNNVARAMNVQPAPRAGARARTILSGGYHACRGLWHRRRRWIFRRTAGAVRRTSGLRCARRTSQGVARQRTAPGNTQGQHGRLPGRGDG